MRRLSAFLLGVVLLAARGGSARDIYKGFLDPGIPRHRAILDTLQKLQVSPNDAGLHNDLGCLIAYDGFWRDALREFRTAAKLDKKDGRPAFNAGLVRAWMGEWSSARRQFREATRRDPGNWPAWWMIGYAEEQLGNKRAALEAYKVSLRVDPSLFDVARNPFAANTRLRAQVLLETYEKRLVRASQPLTAEYSDPARIAFFLQRGPQPVAAAPTPPPQEPARQGPVVAPMPPPTTSRPPVAGAPGSPYGVQQAPPRSAAPEAPSPTPVAPPGTTPAQASPPPRPGPGFFVPRPAPTPVPTPGGGG